MAFQLVTAPATEPVTLAEAKAHLRVVHSVEDDLITSLIVAAREDAESWTRRAFIEQTILHTRDAFPACGGAIELPRPRLIDVTWVKYTDPDGAEQTLVKDTDYLVILTSEPGRIVPMPGTRWPITRAQPGAVRIQFKAGYGAVAAAVPRPIRQAILLTIGKLYLVRSPVITGTIVQALPTVQNLLRPYRIVGAPS